MQEIFTRRSEIHELIISRNSDFFKNKDGGEEEEEKKPVSQLQPQNTS